MKNLYNTIKILFLILLFFIFIGCKTVQKPAIDSKSETPSLLDALHMENPGKAMELIESGTDINVKSITNGVTPIMYAALYGYEDIVKLLIEKNADLNTVSNDGWSPLRYAISYNQNDIAFLLIKNGADVKDVDRIKLSEQFYENAISSDNTDTKLDLLGKAIELNGEYKNALYKRGRIYFDRLEMDLAIDDFSKILTLDENDLDTLNFMGSIYFRLGDFELAESYLLSALKLEPDNKRTRDILFYISMEKNEYSNAYKYINKAIEEEPSYNDYINRALYFLAINDYSKAIENCNYALAKDSMSEMAYFLRGYILAFLEEYGLSMDDLLRALKIEDNFYIHRAFAFNNFQSGDYFESIKYLEESLRMIWKLKEDNFVTDFEYNNILHKTYRPLVLNYYLLGDLEQTNNYFQKLIEVKPENSDLLESYYWSDKENEIFSEVYNWYYSENN